MVPMRTVCVGLAALLLLGPVRASEVGQQIAAQVDVASFQNFIDNVLFTHSADNRGPAGPQHDPCRDVIAAVLGDYGFEVTIETFPYLDIEGENVVATRWGKQFPSSFYIVGAHYDSVSNPGADDDASGVAGLLEIARVFSQIDTAHSLRLIAFDLEEVGLRGSKAYVATHRAEDIRGMVQLDMIAHDAGQNRAAIYGAPASEPFKQAIAAAVAEYGDGLTAQLYGQADFSDHAPFEAAGYQAAWVAEQSWAENPCWHKACDTVDNPGYLSYAYGANQVRSIAGFMADRLIVLATCPGDVDGDGKVQQPDLAILLSAWQACEGESKWIPAADVYKEPGAPACIDQSDLGVLLAQYGVVCPH
jgi:hypothetical protein